MTLEMELVLTPRVSYVMYQNRMDVVLSMRVTETEETLNNVSFRLSSEPRFFEDVEMRVDIMTPGTEIDLLRHPSFSISLDRSFITSLTERLECEVTLNASKDDEEMASQTVRTSLLPFDDWLGCEMAETIASFVMPNSESLATIRASASDILGSWGRSTSLSGYQSDRDGVLGMGAALYAALQRANINYVNPPAGFEANGQRIRVPDDVLYKHEGTCIDLACLYASALESIGLNTLIFFVAGHAFAGFWLVDDCQSDMVAYDPSAATRLIRGNDMRAVECTAFTNAHQIDFEEACDMALKRLEDADRFVCSVDIRRCRHTILPLPGKRWEDGRWVVEREERRETTSSPGSVGEVYIPNDISRELTRVDRWKRDLLDITNRNNMINMKQGTKVAPLLLKDVSSFEDEFSGGREFIVLSKPQEWDGNQIYGERPFETELYVGNYATMAADDMSRGRIRTPMTDTELERSMRSIYRLASKELEESGCNSLFVALGVLRWYEGRSTGVARYAPLILVPAELRKRQTGYSVRRVDEETLFNVTLIEKLRQEFEVTLPMPDPLLSDDSGVNVDQILQIVRRSISRKEGWEVLEGAALGVFSFNQFVMWKDLEDNMDMLMESDVVSSLVESRPFPSDGREMEVSADPYGLCLTVPADGSQIRAVRASGEGKTFIMHGPPGTGKSQTITNMISNVLYNGKTVLFVAEKRAALEVVQKRLEEVGIGNHCLELHSNKSEKGKVLEQLRRSLDACRACDPEKQEELHDQITSMQKRLDAYVSALHQERSWGLSTYEAISRYEAHNSKGTVDITVPTSKVASMGPGSDERIESLVREAAEAYRLVSDIDNETLANVRIDRAVASIREDLEEAFSKAESAADDVKSARETFSALGLPVDPTDEVGAERFFNGVMSIDQRAVGVSDPDALADNLTRVRSDVSDLLNIVSRWSGLGLNVHPENLNNAMGRINSIESEIGKLQTDKGVSLDPIRLFLSDAQRFCEVMTRHRDDMSRVSVQWTDGVYDLNAGWNVSDAWRRVNEAGFFGKGKARKEFISRASGCLKDPNIKFDLLSSTVNIISSIGPDILSVRDVPARYDSNLRQNVTDAMSSMEEFVSILKTASSTMREVGISPSDLHEIRSKVEGAREALRQLSTCGEKWRVCSSEVATMLSTDMALSDVASFKRFKEDLRPYMGRIFDWASWNSYSHLLTEAGFGEVVGLIRSRTPIDTAVDSAYCSLYKTMINMCRQDSDALRVFSADSFESLIDKFKRLDTAYTTLNRNLLKYRLFSRVPSNMDSSANGSEAYTLYRAINSSRMRKSIRRLISEIPNILPKICPCLLMSPQSVAQYITPDFPKFDLVIFDESSQITTCKAIGALGRARSAVIAGDSRQLPPTSFFQKKIESTDDGDDMVDLDSFLDDCLALHLPETCLEWHYRSRHESLIAFSNRVFYDNKMLTFPSPNDQETRVSMIRVNGRYEKGARCNPIEAAAVVDEICRRVKDPTQCKQSIGVVAFSISQQSCIQDTLDDRIRSDPDLFQRINAMPEELFIKNLETVQGDERDAILFSIGYGPDNMGNVSQNFGPINREGGGRRLNVAVSRARVEMVVFSSMGSTDIRLTSSSSGGVRSFREFLRFAENGGRFGEVSERARMGQASAVLRELSEFLLSQGYQTHFGIGNSEFKVDVAIVDPKDPSEYILGILNDGPAYRDSDNTRDREYAREDILLRLGWNIMHVWSLDWYFNRLRVERSVMDKLEELRSKKTEQIVEEPQEEAIDEDIGLVDLPDGRLVPFTNDAVPMKSSRRAPYNQYVPERFYVDSDTAVWHKPTIKHIADPIIVAESPINEELLIRIFCRSVDIKRLRSNKREILIANLRELYNPDENNGFVTYWAPDANRVGFDQYRIADNEEDSRDILQIPLEEIVSAIVETVSDSGSIPEADVPSAVGRTLGFSRCGTNVRDVIRRALECAVNDEKIHLKDGRYTLAS